MNTCNQERVPRWAKRMEDFGRDRRHREKSCGARKGEYIANIIFNLIFLWIISKIPEWNLSFIRDNFNVVVWMLNVSILVQIGGNALMFLIDASPVRHLCRIVMEAAGFLALVVLYYIFPFDFSSTHGLSWLDWALPIFFIIGMVVAAVKIISHAWRLIFGSRNRDE